MLYPMVKSLVISKVEKSYNERLESINGSSIDDCQVCLNYVPSVREKAYKAGKLSFEKLQSIALVNVEKEKQKNIVKYLAKIEQSEAVESMPSEIKITVEWKKSYTWGMNPKCKVWIPYKNYEDNSVSGYGYDKESTAIANCFNQSPEILAIVFQAIENGIKLPYGVRGYWLPQFEGGVGTNCYRQFFELVGYNWTCTGSGKMFDCYYITKK